MHWGHWTSTDLVHWHWCGIALAPDTPADEGVFWNGLPQMLECPDYFELAGMPAGIVSVVGMPMDGRRYPHDQPVVLIAGKGTGDSARLSPQGIFTLDQGKDFYAAQTALSPDGRRLLIGWLQCWAHARMPTDYLGHGWNGCMSIVRELSWEDDRPMQRPVAEMERFRGNRCEREGLVGDGRQACALEAEETAEILVELTDIAADRLELALFQAGDERLLISVEPRKGLITVDASLCGYEIRDKDERPLQNRTQLDIALRDERLSLRIFVDRCSAEIFVNGGETVVSIRVFPRRHGRGVCLKAFAGTARARLTAFELEV